ELAARKDVDPESSAAHLLDDLPYSLSRALEHVERQGPGGGHPPLDLRLRDDVWSIDDGGGGGGGHRTACRHNEPASFGHQAALLTGTANDVDVHSLPDTQELGDSRWRTPPGAG